MIKMEPFEEALFSRVLKLRNNSNNCMRTKQIKYLFRMQGSCVEDFFSIAGQVSNDETIRVQQNGFAAQYSSPMIVQDETCQLIYQPEETSQLSFHPVNCGTIQLGEHQALLSEIKLEEDIF